MIFSLFCFRYQYHLQKKSNVLFGRTGGEVVEIMEGEIGGEGEGGEGGEKEDEATSVNSTLPTWWTQWMAKTLLLSTMETSDAHSSTTSSTTTTTATTATTTVTPSVSKIQKILVLGDIQQLYIDHISNTVSMMMQTTTLDYCASRLISSKQQSDLSTSAGRIQHIVGHAHVLLSTMLVKTKHLPVYDIVMIGQCKHLITFVFTVFFYILFFFLSRLLCADSIEK